MTQFQYIARHPHYALNKILTFIHRTGNNFITFPDFLADKLFSFRHRKGGVLYHKRTGISTHLAVIIRIFTTYNNRIPRREIKHDNIAPLHFGSPRYTLIRPFNCLGISLRMGSKRQSVVSKRNCQRSIGQLRSIRQLADK